MCDHHLERSDVNTARCVGLRRRTGCTENRNKSFKATAPKLPLPVLVKHHPELTHRVRVAVHKTN